MSRLLENSEQLRKDLEARNLYSPENEYSISNEKTVETLNNIVNTIEPFEGGSISRSILERLVNTPRTPLTEIGLSLLAKQFWYTTKSLGTSEFVPSVNFSNLFDGNSNTKFIITKKDFQITRRDSQSGIGRLIEELTGVYRNINPFTSSSTNEDFFRQTGYGQQEKIISLLKLNKYKKSNNSWINAINEDKRLKTLGYENFSLNDIYFSDSLNPFQSTPFLEEPDILNRRLNNSFTTQLINGRDNNGFFEYGSNLTFIKDLGVTSKILPSEFDQNGNILIDSDNYGLDDDLNNKLIWGRDGASSRYRGDVNGFDKNPNTIPTFKFSEGDLTINEEVNRFDDTDRFSSFGAQSGLLAYTKELLNSKGKYGNFDLTKKKFIDDNNKISYNGSPVTREVTGEENRSRQHNVTDPYNRFVKAIRFKGNIIYQGNEDSVINKTVIPKIHPTLDSKSNINVKNLMFSIENLAAGVNKDDENKVAYLDDQFGTQIPFCEAGEHGGRLMWFAPYDIKLSEQDVVRRETTNFIGRSEPIYTYNNTERVASLSFKLLIDYPPQVKGFNNNSDVASFFAFGGTGNEREPVDISKLELSLKEKIDRRNELNETVVFEKPDLSDLPTELSLYFPNDVPEVGNANASSITSFIVSGYENGVNDEYEIDGRDFGLNSDFNTQLNKIIDESLSVDNRRFFSLYIVGEATQLFLGQNQTNEAYNLALGQRRADALKDYIDNRFKQKYGKTLESEGIIHSTTSLGQKNAPSSTSTADSIPEKTAKTYRVARLVLVQNDERDERTRTLTPTQIEELEILNKDINNLTIRIANAKSNLKGGFGCTFNQYGIEDGLIKGFRPFKQEINKFMPVYHSQTPEDFHKRLTFLHQCTRQGNPVRQVVENNDGVTNFSTKNSVFGRQPIQILRLGDFFHTKIVIDNITYEYGEAPWDQNPEGMGMQFMYADITIQMKIIGGQSLKTPIDALQNAVSFNYYANSTYYNKGIYQTPSRVEAEQVKYNNRENDEIERVRTKGTSGIERPPESPNID